MLSQFDTCLFYRQFNVSVESQSNRSSILPRSAPVSQLRFGLMKWPLLAFFISALKLVSCLFKKNTA